MTKKITLKNLSIGGGSKISVQSMLNCDTLNRAAVFAQIDALLNEGCDIIRLAVENSAAAEICKEYIQYCPAPLVADIHFDYKLAVMCAQIGFAKIRINPGNIGGEEKLKEVIAACKANGTVIRLGVNGGSLEKDLREKYGVCAESLAESALRNIKIFEKQGFENLIISIKASTVKTTIEANRILSKSCAYPLHIGVTETGAGQQALIKSAIGIGSLLSDGIGDTIRVSLTDDPIEEVKAGKGILKALNLLDHVEIVSCPTCSRCKYDLKSVAYELSQLTRNMNKKLKIAVMGCAVNGPGEAAAADFGVAGGDGKAVIFKKGKIIGTVETGRVLDTMKKMIEEEEIK